MEKRLVTFLVLSAVIITGHYLVQRVFFPAPVEVAQQEDADQPGEEDAEPDASKKGAAGDTKKAEGDASKSDAEESDDGKSKAGDASAKKKPAAKSKPPAADSEDAEPEQLVTLGSFNPKTGYRLLVTFNSRGGSVERVELVERDDKGRLRYRDLLRTYGYPGLYTHDTKNGCAVKVVGPGTPAAKADMNSVTNVPGLVAGDVIVRANDDGITNTADFEAFLAKTKPGDDCTFVVRRGRSSIEFSIRLDHWPLQLVQPETPVPNGLELNTAGNTLLVTPEATHDDPKILSCLVGLHSVGTAVRSHSQDELAGVPSLKQANWKLSQPNDHEIVFTKRIAIAGTENDGELEFVKRFKLSEPTSKQDGGEEEGEEDEVSPFADYHLQLDVEVHNLGDKDQTVSYVMDGPNGLPLEGWWYTNKIHPKWGTAGARDIVWRVNGYKHSLRSASQIYKQVREAEGDPHEAIESILTENASPEDRTLDYLGVDTQYFSAVLLAGTMAEPQSFICQEAYPIPVGDLPELTGKGMKQLNTTYRMVSMATPIEPGTTVVDQYHLFLGPKSPEVLAAYELHDVIEYGWFGKIARPLAWLLHLFYGIVRNYGLAIVLLTVLVRGAMFPIGRKAARNAQIMQELAPEIKKIKEKYKNDLEKQGQAQRDLWKRHNFNPLSGCWLMFLQLPIFIGLYRSLSVDIQLRQAPLIPGIKWCSNLAGPDMAWRWQGVMPDFFAAETGWLGPYLNILPMITIVLFIAQQKMFTPPATDEQTQMQQKMMKYMMIFMGFLFFKVPAGLCIYFIASSLWGIGERKLLPKPSNKPAETNDTPPPASGGKGGGGKGGGGGGGGGGKGGGGKSGGPDRGKAAPEKVSWLQRLQQKADAEARIRHKKRK